MPSWASQAVSNLTWALATIGLQPGPPYLAAASRRMLASLGSWPPQHLANTLWALATLGHVDMGFMQQVADHLVQRIDADPDFLPSFKPQHVSNILWAYGTLECPCHELASRLAGGLQSRVEEFSSQELSNSIWALAKCAFYDCAFMDAFAAHTLLPHRLAGLQPQHMSNIAWSFSRVTHSHPDLMKALAEHATRAIQALTPQHISNMVNTFAILDLHPSTFLAAAKQQILTRCGLTAASEAGGSPAKQQQGGKGSPVQGQQGGAKGRGGAGGGRAGGGGNRPQRSFNAQQVTNLLWGLSLLGELELPLWRALQAQLQALGVTTADLPEEALTQVFQAYLLLLAECPGEADRGQLEGGALPGLLAEAEACWRATACQPIVSAMHREVSLTLDSLGVRHTNEQMTADGLFSVDIVLEALPPDLMASLGLDVGAPLPKMLGIEVDGPSHFTANLGTPLGVTLARRRCLAARGWRLASLHHSDWGVARTVQQRVALVKGLLQEVTRNLAVSV
ncbi:hypothetical protein V8C86DRAFT_3136640 [Haematococcus lacustris]